MKKTARVSLRKSKNTPPTQENLAKAKPGQWGVLLLAALLLLLGGLQIYLSTVVATTGRKSSFLQTQRDELATINNQLRTKINSLSALVEIERKARDQLQMEKRDQAFYYLTPEYLVSLGVR